MIWAVTSPERVPAEPALLNDLAATGPVTLLIRKPGWTIQEYAALLEQLHDHSRVIISGHVALLKYFPAAGFHLSEKAREGSGGKITPEALLAELSHANKNNGVTPNAAPFIFSTSIHSAQSPGPEWRYLLLGPVFNSISKTGHAGKGHLFGSVPSNALAVGGVDAGNIARVKTMGFCGAALLGAIWQHPANAVKNYQIIQQLWERS